MKTKEDGKSRDITEFKDQIYFMTKRIIKEQFPDELLFFGIEWSSFWDKICQLRDKPTQEWKIEDLQETPSGVFSYPSQAVNLKFKILGLVNTAIINDFIELKTNPNREEIEKIIISNMKRHGASESLYPRIFSLVMETIHGSISKPSEKEPLPRRPTEKKESPSQLTLLKEEEKGYKVYSHENKENPQEATEDDIEELEKRALEENAFDVYFDFHKKEVIVNGRTECFNPDKVYDGWKKVRLLELILKNVGRTVSKTKLLNHVWLGDEVKDGSIEQMLRRLSAFCDGKIRPFWEFDKTEYNEAGERKVRLIIYKKKGGEVFKYCLVEKI